MKPSHKERRRILLAGCLFVLSLGSMATPGKAGTQYWEKINAAEACQPDYPYSVLGNPNTSPPYSFTARPVAHMLWGFSDYASCQLRMTKEWPIENLKQVFITFISNTPGTWVRLCIYGNITVAGLTAATCSGPQTQLAPGFFPGVLSVPTLPPNSVPEGAYLRVGFPAYSEVKIIRVVPLWEKP